MARLIILAESGERTVELGPNTTIGRHPRETITIVDKCVHKTHCKIELDDGEWVLEDAGSLNGTFVGGERLSGPRRLRDGDKIRVGATQLLFEDGSTPHVSPPKPVEVPEHHRILELFPALSSRVPPSARVYRNHASGFVYEGLTTTDDETAQIWSYKGGIGALSPTRLDAFLAVVRGRSTEEILVVMVSGGRTFNFLEKCLSPWEEKLPTAQSALDEALRRWDRGESVYYLHRFTEYQ